MEKYTVLDIETQKWAEEVKGGWNNIAGFGLAIAVCWHQTEDGGYFQPYQDNRASLEVTRKNKYKEYYDLLTSQQLIQDLYDVPKIITFNGIHFDYEVLRPYGLRPEKLYPKSFDILNKMQKVLGHRVSLESVAQATLGEGKGGSGTEAVKWFREGKIDKVIEYCKKDVELTKRIYDFIRERGYAHYLSLSGEVRTCHLKTETGK